MPRKMFDRTYPINEGVPLTGSEFRQGGRRPMSTTQLEEQKYRQVGTQPDSSGSKTLKKGATDPVPADE